MKKRFTEEQIIKMLQEAECGLTVQALWGKYAIGSATYYRWKTRFSGITLSEARKLKTLEADSKQVKRLVAEQALDIVALKDIVTKSSDPTSNKSTYDQVSYNPQP